MTGRLVFLFDELDRFKSLMFQQPLVAVSAGTSKNNFVSFIKIYLIPGTRVDLSAAGEHGGERLCQGLPPVNLPVPL